MDIVHFGVKRMDEKKQQQQPGRLEPLLYVKYTLCCGLLNRSHSNSIRNTRHRYYEKKRQKKDMDIGITHSKSNSPNPSIVHFASSSFHFKCWPVNIDARPCKCKKIKPNQNHTKNEWTKREKIEIRPNSCGWNALCNLL